MGGIVIDKDKVDAWTGGMREAFGGQLPPEVLIPLVIGLSILVVLAMLWVAGVHLPRPRHQAH